MKIRNASFKIITGFFVAIMVMGGFSCKKDGNPNNLPPVSPDDYEGKIDGFSSSDEVFPENLIAQWTFNENTNEKLSNSAPTTVAGQSLVDGGVIGKALSLNAGYLYFARQFPKFTTADLKSFSISVWVKILNNGTKRTMLMQMARPGLFTGNINFSLNTNQFPASNTDILRIVPTFATVGGGTQDNANFTFSPKIGMDKWTHIVLTYEASTGVFNNWADGVKVGQFPNRGTGNNSFKAWEPNEFIIGSNYNGIPGKEVSADVSFAPMTGQIDEIRMWDRSLPDAFILALFNLGKAGK
jgi:hypothetical protein